MLGDILNTTKRTKLHENEEVLFFNINSLLPTENSNSINSEQISFLLKKDILVSFQEKRSDFITHIRERIRTHSGIVRNKKADYLLYLLLDAVIDNYYITIDNEEDEIGFRCVAAPILNQIGYPIGAISITASTARTTLQDFAKIGNHLIAVCLDLKKTIPTYL